MIAKIRIAPLLVIGITHAFSLAQQGTDRMSAGAPHSEIIVVKPFKGLKPSTTFKAILKFDQAPPVDGQGDRISYEFQRIPLESTSPRFHKPSEQTAFDGVVPMHNGQSRYELSVPIGDQMANGEWKLVAITFGAVQQTSLSIPRNIAFEVAGGEPWFQIKTPTKVTAGVPFHITATIKEFPKSVLDEKCALYLFGSVHRDGPLRGGIPMIALRSVALTPNKDIYELGAELSADVPNGRWTGEVFGRADPSSMPNSPRSPAPGECKSFLPYAGTFTFDIAVEAKAGKGVQ